MNNLIAYYTRTGTCKSISEEICKLMEDCEIDEIIDEIDYSGIIGWLKAGYNETRKKQTTITYKKNACSFDTVVIVTPVWANGMTPAIREYIKKELNGFKTLYIISSCLGSSSIKISAQTAKTVEIAQQTFCITKKEKNRSQVIKEITRLLSK